MVEERGCIAGSGPSNRLDVDGGDVARDSECIGTSRRGVIGCDRNLRLASDTSKQKRHEHPYGQLQFHPALASEIR